MSSPPIHVQLASRLAAIRHALVVETEANPSEVLAYGRPHSHARVLTFPKYTASGAPAPGRWRLPPDCPKPLRGRCECQPDGSWRPSVGSRRADSLAHTAEMVEWEGKRLWTNTLYVQQIDKTWVCARPVRAAYERLHRRSLRRFLVIERLFSGKSLVEAWADLGHPPDLTVATHGICRDIETWAAEEEAAVYIRRPNYWRVTPRLSFLDKSESQANAEDAA